MAKADDYAKWIVDNQSKKGTPDFDTVVNAYQIAKKEESFDSKDLVSQIPGQEARFAVTPTPSEKMAGEPKFLERAAMYAGGVPVAAGLARGAQLASAGTRAAPYVGRLAEAVIPKTGKELAKMGAGAVAASVPAEAARYSAEQRGAGVGGQTLAEMAGGLTTAGLGSALTRTGKKVGEVVSKALPGEFKTGAEALRKRITGVAEESAPDLLQQEISALERGRTAGVASERAAERDIRGAQSKVQTQLQERTKQAKASEQQALQQVAPEKVTDEQLGGFIQPKGRANVERLKETRQTEAITKIKDPAFEQARSREAKGQTIESFPASANQFRETIAEIENQIEKTPEPFRSQLKARYASIKGRERPLSEAEKRVEQLRAASIPGYQPKSVATEPLTLDEAEFLRRMLKDKDLSKVEGFAAIDPFRMNALGDRLLESMKLYEPRIGDYIAEYERRSVPVTKALAGRGEKAIETELGKEPNILFSEDKKAVANYYLDGTAQRANRLLDLVGGKSPEVTKMVAGNIRSKVEGMDSKSIRDFVQKNEGLLSVFPEVRQSTEALAKSREAVEKASRMTSEQTKRLGESLGVPSTTTKLTPESLSALKQDVSNFLSNIKDAAPKQVISDSKSFIDQLKKGGRLSTEQYQSLSKQIQDIEKTGIEQQEAAKKVRQVMLGLASVGGAYGVARTASGLLGL
jgi:hypothetical protein